jgi:hypothetical protein
VTERTTQQRAAQAARTQSGRGVAGPKAGPLAQLATALNASPPVQRLEAPKRQLAQRAANRTGLPDNVKSGVEALSGMSMDHVRVHYNSPKPAQLNAHAYAQGSEIHVAPGQQRHVPHEAWHVVQQAQGRVRATAQMKGGVAINDDKALESEADRVGQIVAQPMARGPDDGATPGYAPAQRSTARPNAFIQRRLAFEGVADGIAQLRALLGRDTEAQKLLSLWASDDTPLRIVRDLDATAGEIRELADEKRSLSANLRRQGRALKLLVRRHNAMQIEGARNQRMTELLSLAHQQFELAQRGLVEWSWERARIDRERMLIYRLDHVLEEVRNLRGTADAEAPMETHQLPVVNEDWDEREDISHLHGIKEQLASPNTKKAIGKLRGTDDEEPRQHDLDRDRDPERSPPPGALKGPILYRYIRNNRRAILDLVQHVGDSVALFSLERGGAFLADLVTDFRRERGDRPIPNFKISKEAGKSAAGVYSRGRHHLAMVIQMMDVEEGQMFNILSRNPTFHQKPPMVTIGLTETAVSGASVNKLLTTLDDYHEMLPQSRFNVLVEKQTIKEPKIPRDERGGLRHTDPGISLEHLKTTDSVEKVRMFIAHTEYILGEDVGYQISYDGRLAGQPLIVFDESSDELVAVRLSSHGMLPRDLLRLLIGGALDSALDEIFL